METRDILTTDTVRRDLIARVRGRRRDTLLGFGMISIPFGLIAFFTLIFEAYWWALSMVLIPVVLFIIEGVAKRRALRRIAGLPITLCEAALTEIVYDEVDEPWLWTRLLVRHHYRIQLADYLVFGKHGRAKDIYGLAKILMVGEKCYLALDEKGEIRSVYSSRAWRMK